MTVRYVVFVACVAAALLAHGAILLSVARRPALTADAGVPRPRRGLEILWALIPAVVLALVFTATWDRLRSEPAEPAAVMKVAR